MQEPPIASPFGESVPVTAPPPPDTSLPLTLKLMIGISLVVVAINVFQFVVLLQHAPATVYSNVPMLLFRFGLMAIRVLLIVGLLWRNKLCWWGTQLSNVYNCFVTIRVLSILLPGRSDVVAWCLPSLTVELTLFVWLLLPSIRRRFFSKP